MLRRMLHFVRLTSAVMIGPVMVAAVLAASFMVTGTAPAAAKCFTRPVSQMSWSDGEFAVSISVDLELNTANTVPANHGAAVDQMTDFPAEAVAAVDEFFADITNWFMAPCEALLAKQTNRFPGVAVPPAPQAPFGFGGVDAKAAIPMAVEVTAPEPEPATAPGNEVVIDGVHLAKSGSETAVMVYFGLGLVAFGAAALGMRRRL